MAAVGLATMAWVFSAGLGPWALFLALIGLALVVALATIFFTLHHREPSEFMLSPSGWMAWALPLPLVAAGAWLLIQGVQDATHPNFILHLIEDHKPISQQKAHIRRVVSPGIDEERVERVTNDLGEAYFTLALGSERLYLAGLEIVEGAQVKRCQFPAFFLKEARKITYDLMEYDCREASQQVGANAAAALAELDRDMEHSALRVVSKARSAAPEAVDVSRLPVNLVARRARAPLGLPSAPLVLDRIYYTLGFDLALRAARWVSFTVDAPNTLRLPRRPETYFVPDPDLPEGAQTRPEDYRQNPYDRGHLVRRLDVGLNLGEETARKAESEIFFYSLIVPQPDVTKRYTWRYVEEFTTELTEKVGPIHVIAGPVYQDSQSSNSPYLVIGPGKTVVPIALFRVLLRKARDGQWRALGFMVPNDGSRERDPRRFAVPIVEIEAATGLTFFPNLPEAEARYLKAGLDYDGFAVDLVSPSKS